MSITSVHLKILVFVLALVFAVYQSVGVSSERVSIRKVSRDAKIMKMTNRVSFGNLSPDLFKSMKKKTTTSDVSLKKLAHDLDQLAVDIVNLHDLECVIPYEVK